MHRYTSKVPSKDTNSRFQASKMLAVRSHFKIGSHFCGNPVSFLFVVSVSFRYVFFCSRWSFVDVPLIFICPADHVPDWQPGILLGIMVDARSVNAKKTTPTTIR